MLTRRKVLLSAAALAALGTTVPAFAVSDALLSDLLVGVTDALTREYIRSHYREGRWENGRWYYQGRWYTPDEYRRHLSAMARPAPAPHPAPKPEPKPKPQPKPAPHQPARDHGPKASGPGARHDPPKGGPVGGPGGHRP